jgi:outer membrane lipoprotein carrier protein
MKTPRQPLLSLPPLLPLLAAAVIALPGPGLAEEPPAPPPTPAQSTGAAGVQRIDRLLDGLHSLSARFRQRVSSPDRRQESHAEGVFYLQRPDRLRWDYETPFRQEIVADGTRVWVLDAEIEQVSVKFQSQALAGTPALLLVGKRSADSYFDILDLGTLSDGLEWLHLRPKDAEESQFSTILVGFAGDELRAMETTDKFNQLTRFDFYAMQRNPPLNPKLFVFTPPPGYDLFNP